MCVLFMMRDGFFKVIWGGLDKKDRICVVSSSFLRAMEIVIIVTFGVDYILCLIVVMDYLCECIEFNVLFEVCWLIFIDEGEDLDVLKLIKNFYAYGCKFYKGLREFYGDDVFMFNVEMYYKYYLDCRVDKMILLLYMYCGGFMFMYEVDLELGDEREENIIVMMNCVKVVFVNVFDRYDEEVVMFVMYFDFIILVLMELYFDMFGFVL